ncbi:MAG: FliM/FliN family flagellar motor switch protein, partial [Terriglobales bacterium]
DLAAHWELSGGLVGKLSLKFHRTAARGWARLLQAGFAEEKPPSPTSPLTDPEKEALEEVLHNLARELAAAFQAGGWGEIHVHERHFGPLRRAVEGADGEFPLCFAKPEAESLELDLVMEPALRDQSRKGPLSPDAASEAALDGSRVGSKLDLLLDVELDVTLRFGGRQMLLHDVLELAPSSVLELDRHIDDPVELLVGGKVIAWGEVVVVDGNYGLRITRLVHRKERMAAVGEGARPN